MEKKPRHSLSNIDPEAKEADCAACETRVPIRKRSSNRLPDGTWSKVWACAPQRNRFSKEYTDRTHWHIRKRGVVRPHGLTREEAVAFKEGKVCEVCGSPETIQVDHCHASGKIRGTLCRDHNLALGLFRDNAEHMLIAIEYLTRAREEETTP